MFTNYEIGICAIYFCIFCYSTIDTPLGSHTQARNPTTTMSSGGVFKLVANDGKTDRLLLATALLNQRIRDVICARRAMGKDPTPTLLDLEKTHVLHINAHFKPFAALGFEYNKVRPNTGSGQLDGQVQFSIPQFGDFFHDMVARTVLTSTYEAGRTGTVRANTTTSTSVTNQQYGIQSTLPADGQGWNNAGGLNTATNFRTYSLVDVFGNDISEGADSFRRNMVRYVEYPAERLFANVQFDVNGNPLDEYGWRAANMLRKFTISDEKLQGYKQLVGQEVPIEGFGAPRIARIEDTDYDKTVPEASSNHGLKGTVAGSSLNQGLTPEAYMEASEHQGANLAAGQWSYSGALGGTNPTDNLAVTTNPVLGDNEVDVGVEGAQWGHVQRPRLQAYDGPQTPKYWQPELEVWNRLWFWFCQDVHLSIPSVSIPFGQRFITVSFASGEQLVQDFPGVFVKCTQYEVIDNAVDDATVSAGAQIAYRPYWEQSNINYPTLKTVELYINNIFVNPEVHDLFIRRVGFSLIRVFRQQTTGVNTSSDDSLLLSQLKWPIELMLIGFQPVHNTNTKSVSYHRDWHRYGKTFDSVLEANQQAITGIKHEDPDGAIMVKPSNILTSSIGQIVPDTFVIERPIVTELSLTAHGVKIHDAFPQAFFSKYEPFHYGGACLRPPSDPGAMAISFGVDYGKYQPNGYLNVSRARELYIHWKTLFTSSSTPVTFFGLAIAINFLLVADGSAVLRYST